MVEKVLVHHGRRWTQPLLLLLSLLGIQHAYSQADVMNKIYTALSGDGNQGPVPTGWGTGDPCGWAGVTCGGDGVVTQLDLTAWKFTGDWPNSINDELPGLQVLNAAGVGFTGAPPTSLNSPALMTVDLSKNKFDGQTPTVNAANLTTLNLSNNMFVGAGYVGNAVKLTSLDLSFNAGITNFNIDSLGLGNLKALQTLDISNCGFTGQLPTNWASLTGLQTLKLSNNMFMGDLPKELGLLSNSSLKVLDISGNEFTGEVPPGYGALGAGFTFLPGNANLVPPTLSPAAGPTAAPPGVAPTLPPTGGPSAAPTTPPVLPPASEPTPATALSPPPPDATATPPAALSPPPGVCSPCSTGVLVNNATCTCVAPINATILLPQAKWDTFSSSESPRTDLKNNLKGLLGVQDSQVLVYPSQADNNAVKASVLLLPLPPATSWSPSEQMRIQSLLKGNNINFGGQLGPMTVSSIVLPGTTPALSSPTTPVATPPAPPSSGKKKSSIGPLVGAAVGALAVVAILAGLLVCCCVRKKQSKERPPMASGFDSDQQHKDIGDYEPPVVKTTLKTRQASYSDTPAVDTSLVIGTAKLYDLRDLQTATNFFARENIIGEGSFGRVYKAEMPDGKVLAVKKLELPNTSQKTNEFQGVVRTVSSLNHENLVRLDGYVAEGAFLLAYDYVGNGSLFDHLHTAESGQLVIWPQRVRIALGTARALQYLHESNTPPVIHRNVKSANILLDENMMPYVADTGLTVLGQGPNAQASTQMLGAIGYAAPEYAMSGQHTAKSDVYSFGVVCLELLTGRRPLDSSRPRMEQSLVRWAVPQLQDVDALARMADPKLQGHYPIKSLARFADIIALCVQPEPEFRPPMSDVVQALVRLMQRSSQKVKNSGELFSGDLTGRDSFV